MALWESRNPFPYPPRLLLHVEEANTDPQRGRETYPRRRMRFEESPKSPNAATTLTETRKKNAKGKPILPASGKGA